MKNQIKFYAKLLVLLPLMLTGCAYWHSYVRSTPPQYTLYPSAALLYRINNSNWEHIKENVFEDITNWDRNYTNALNEIYPWVPATDALDATMIKVAKEYGMTDPTYLNIISNTAYPFLNNYIDYEYSLKATNGAVNNEMRMLVRADAENSQLLSSNIDDLNQDPTSKYLPTMTNPETPVGVSLTAQWNENPSAKSATSTTGSTGTNQIQATFDKLTVTFQAAAATNSISNDNSTQAATGAKGETKDKDTAIADYEEDQTINLSMSAMLNSASTLDRIDSVSTYVYIYPWTVALNGNVVLEKEFWENFFSANLSRDPLIRTHQPYLQADLLSAIGHLRVKVHDLSTLVDYGEEDIGMEQQAFNDTGTVGLTGSAKASPFTAISPTASYTESSAASTTTTPKEQIDRRSTYIDGTGDFFRINLRGLESLDLAGRFKESITIHVPTANEPMLILIPPKKNTTNLCELQEVSQPVYRKVDALTFSVAVARETTKLAATSEDKYGLNDRNNAAFIVGVTTPEHIVLWQWERSFPNITSWDVFGKKGDHAQPLYFNTISNGVPSPLCVSDNFELPDLLNLLDHIKSATTNGLTHLSIGTRSIDIGCITNETDPVLVPIPR